MRAVQVAPLEHTWRGGAVNQLLTTGLREKRLTVKMFGPMTSSPKRRGKQKEGPRLPPSVSDSIWCGDEKVEEEGSRCDNNDQVRIRRREEEGIVKSDPAPVMMRLEEELKELASGGRTKDLLHLLEEGAPFVVDMVSHNLPHDLAEHIP